MADLTIPKEHQPLLNQIRKLSDTTLDALVSALERSPGATSSVQGLPPDEAEALQDFVKELYSVREFFDSDVPEFALEVATALQELENFPANEVPALAGRLTRLLTIQSVAIATKATSLKAEYERRFCSARLMTDARPIYGEDPAKQPSAAIIVHTLRISYHDNTRQLREFYVAMEGDDIKSMRTLLDRAELKARSLESVFAEAKVKIVS